MYDYMCLIRRIIGMRIRRYRKQADVPQFAVTGIERATLSNIENGKVTNRNPYFINASQIFDICAWLKYKEYNSSASELVWGTKPERADLIKMMMLAILLNKATANPFSELSFPKWLTTLDEATREQVKANMSEMEETYHYFINPQNHDHFELLQIDFDKSYERISNVILKQLLMDEGFSVCFTRYLAECSNYESQKYEALVKNYLLNKDSFSEFILDKRNYLQFISAFDRYWKRVHAEYIQFFEKDLFVGDEVLKEKGMREIRNEKIHQVLISPEFLELNELSLLIDEYSNMDTATACMMQRIRMVAMINKDSHEMFCGDDEIEIAEPNYKDFI